MEFHESYKNFFMICIAVISQMIAILYILEKTFRRFFAQKLANLKIIPYICTVKA